MDVIELRRHRQDLEEDLRKRLVAFSTLTGVAIKSVDARFIPFQAIEMLHPQFVLARVNVELDV